MSEIGGLLKSSMKLRSATFKLTAVSVPRFNVVKPEMPRLLTSIGGIDDYCGELNRIP